MNGLRVGRRANGLKCCAIACQEHRKLFAPCDRSSSHQSKLYPCLSALDWYTGVRCKTVESST